MALKPLSLEQLISAPLRALVLGQEAADQVTADFVSKVGFEAGPAKTATVRNLEFEYSHPFPDPSNPGGIVETPTRVRVPLLTMLPVPNLRISEATVTFGANIVDMDSTKAAARAPTMMPLDTTEVGTSAPKLIGVYAPSASATGHPAPTLVVSIKVAKEDPAEGLARVLAQLSDAITSLPKKK